VRLNQIQQPLPGHDLFHIREKLLSAGHTLFGLVFGKGKAELLHGHGHEGEMQCLTSITHLDLGWLTGWGNKSGFTSEKKDSLLFGTKPLVTKQRRSCQKILLNIYQGFL
jgi:hypothetical protein